MQSFNTHTLNEFLATGKKLAKLHYILMRLIVLFIKKKKMAEMRRRLKAHKYSLLTSQLNIAFSVEE